MPEVTKPTPQFNLEVGTGIAGGGFVYIGQPNEDPTVLANRIDVTIIDIDGSSVPIAPASQPFDLNSAAMFDYNGSVVQLRTTQNYSMTVQNAQGELVYYFPSAAAGTDVSTSIIELAATSTPSAISGSGQLYTKSSGGGIELFYLDAADNEIQFSLGGNLNVDLPQDNVTANSFLGNYYQGNVVALASVDNEVDLDWTAGQYFILTNTENTTLNFSQMPLIGDGIGQTIVVAIEDAGDFSITLNPELGYTVYVRSVDNPIVLTPGGEDLVFLTVYSADRVLAVPLYNFVELGS